MKCSTEYCRNRAYYGYKKSDNDKYCHKHKKINMHDMIRSICIKDDCIKRSSFGLIKSKPLYCRNHSSSDMFNVITRTCGNSNCHKFPIFGYSRKILPHYCKSHSKCDMISLYK